jgi:DNA-binding response OmpR family regulator
VKVLIVEDELIVALSNAMMLRKSGYEVEIVKSADEAVATYCSFNPDIILMDIQFKTGKLNGIDAAFEIRKSSPVPIIFISGNKPESIKKLKNASHMAKPINFMLLEKCIKQLIGN